MPVVLMARPSVCAVMALMAALAFPLYTAPRDVNELPLSSDAVGPIQLKRPSEVLGANHAYLRNPCMLEAVQRVLRRAKMMDGWSQSGHRSLCRLQVRDAPAAEVK